MILANALNNDELITFLVILGTFIAIIVFIITLCIINNKLNNLVIQNSEYIKAIKFLNNKYRFIDVRQTSVTKTFYLKSKRQFDCFNYHKKGSDYIVENSATYGCIIRNIETNREMFRQYSDEIDALKHTSDVAIAKRCKMSINSFVKRETNIKAKLLKIPTIDFSIIIEWKYISPAGRNHYSDACTFYYDSIKQLVLQQQQTSVNKKITQNQKTTPKAKTIEQSVTLDDIEDLDV